MKLYEELEWRGFIKDVSDEALAKKLLNEDKITFYCGFDPTADSLTVGHLVQIIRILLLQKYGHKPIVLVGGATGLIGDPKESGERKLLTLDESLKNAEKLKVLLSKYIDSNDAIMVNNYDWISKINVIEFLRDYGKNFSINYMLAKDSVTSRLESGISYTEFSYMILQAIDFMYLYKNYNCRLQFGGSDQWGNITAGLELIRKTINDKDDILGISSNLLMKSDGTKFGKSEKGALWLNKELTSPYTLYQYFVNTTDSDVVQYLKSLTLLEPDKIIELEDSVKSEPHLRKAQKELAKEIVVFLHGNKEYENALKITEALFSGNILDLSKEELEDAFKDAESFIVEDENILDVLVNNNVVASKREAREFISNGALYLNGKKIDNEELILNKSNTLYDKYYVFRKGKKYYYLGIIK
ncbi:MAG TPA: tyrosine--tRNA ligase [Bacilli bacterium]|nr:tyrosine--tRNA ligase [Bacilli bacterium]